MITQNDVRHTLAKLAAVIAHSVGDGFNDDESDVRFFSAVHALKPLGLAAFDDDEFNACMAAFMADIVICSELYEALGRTRDDAVIAAALASNAALAAELDIIDALAS